MVQQRPLGEARRPRRVLDHHRIGRSHDRQFGLRPVAGFQKCVPLVEANDLPQFRAAGWQRLNRRQHRIAAEFRYHHDAGRARLLQDIFDLARPEAGIDGDQNDARHGGAKLDHDPFGNVVGPDRDPFARLEAGPQRPRRAQRLRVQLGIGPLPAVCRVGDAGDQRDPVGRRFCRPSQQLAQRDVAHRRLVRARRMGHCQHDRLLRKTCITTTYPKPRAAPWAQSNFHRNRAATITPRDERRRGDTSFEWPWNRLGNGGLIWEAVRGESCHAPAYLSG